MVDSSVFWSNCSGVSQHMPVVGIMGNDFPAYGDDLRTVDVCFLCVVVFSWKWDHK